MACHIEPVIGSVMQIWTPLFLRHFSPSACRLESWTQPAGLPVEGFSENSGLES